MQQSLSTVLLRIHNRASPIFNLNNIDFLHLLSFSNSKIDLFLISFFFPIIFIEDLFLEHKVFKLVIPLLTQYYCMESIEPFVILKDHRSRVESIAKIKRLVKEMQQSKAPPRYFWVGQEHEIYIEILKIYNREIQSKDERKEMCIFSMMSRIIQTRTPKQVKTHHQKMLKRWHDIPGIVQNSSLSYRREDERRKKKEDEGRSPEQELPKVKVEEEEEEKVAKEQAREEGQKGKLRDARAQEVARQQAEEVGRVKEEVNYERYYPFLRLFEPGNLYNQQYAWNATNWVYGMVQPVKEQDEKKWN